MDRREAMELSGSTSYYMQGGMSGTGSGLQGSPSINPFGNPSVSFQSNIGASSVESTLPVESSSTIPHHGVNASALSTSPLTQPVRRKRGRPRKYGPDGAVSLALSPLSSTHPENLTPVQKRGRGRPPGTGRKQQLAPRGEWLSGSTGTGFTPHVITVTVGEDITTKIMSFSKQRPRAICVLSANGAISTVTLRQPSTFGGTITYEGCFEILCLSGSYLPTDSGGPRGRTGSLSVSLASSDGRVIGGGVGGGLIAASPVQVIVGSFLCGSLKTKSKAGESLESGGDSDPRTVDDPVTQASLQPSQDLTPTSSIGVWGGARPMDVRNVHVDIDLMHG